MRRTVIGQRHPLGQQHAQLAIPRQRPGAGEDQVAHPREPCEGLRPCPERRAEPGHFREAAGQQRRARIVAQPETFEDAGGDRHGVLQAACQFNADDITPRVHPEVGRTEELLHGLARRLIE